MFMGDGLMLVGVAGQSRRRSRLHFLDPFVGVVAFGEGCNLEPANVSDESIQAGAEGIPFRGGGILPGTWLASSM